MKLIIHLTILFLVLFSCQSLDQSNLDLRRLYEIDQLINSSIESNQIPGAVILVGDKKNIIYQKAYGIKNPETNEKYKIDDIFRIASMTKAITSLGIIKLW